MTISMYTDSNLYLKPVTLFEDWLHIEKITNAAEYLKYDPEKPTMTPAQQEDFWHNSVETGKVMIVGIYTQEDDELLGHINLFDFDMTQKSCEMGINVLPPENFGKGIGTAAIPLALDFVKKNTGVLSVYILTHITNIPSQRLFHKCGFKQMEWAGKDEIKMGYWL